MNKHVICSICRSRGGTYICRRCGRYVCSKCLYGHGLCVNCARELLKL